MEVYQLTLLGVSTNPPSLPGGLVDAFDNLLGGLSNVLISDPVYPPYIRNVCKRLMYYLVHLSSPTPT